MSQSPTSLNHRVRARHGLTRPNWTIFINKQQRLRVNLIHQIKPLNGSGSVTAHYSNPNRIEVDMNDDRRKEDRPASSLCRNSLSTFGKTDGSSLRPTSTSITPCTPFGYLFVTNLRSHRHRRHVRPARRPWGRAALGYVTTLFKMNTPTVYSWESLREDQEEELLAAELAR